MSSVGPEETNQKVISNFSKNKIESSAGFKTLAVINIIYYNLFQKNDWLFYLFFSLSKKWWTTNKLLAADDWSCVKSCGTHICFKKIKKFILLFKNLNEAYRHIISMQLGNHELVFWKILLFSGASSEVLTSAQYTCTTVKLFQAYIHYWKTLRWERWYSGRWGGGGYFSMFRECGFLLIGILLCN